MSKHSNLTVNIGKWKKKQFGRHNTVELTISTVNVFVTLLITYVSFYFSNLVAFDRSVAEFKPEKWEFFLN